MFETIVALATPPFKGALGIIRLSGDDCFNIVSNIFSKSIEFEEKNRILHGFLKDGEEIIDEVVLLLYRKPFSFTGENSAEIICHGSPLIFNKIIQACIKNGARYAKNGEFSSRSYMHGKMDLIQAEAINDLILAETEESKKLSLLSLQGKTSKLIAPIKKDFGDLLSNIEVNIDYPEYQDIEEANYEKIEQVANKNINYIKELIKDGKKGRIIKDGINVAIVGKPNVGKSSILNSLLEEEKAIVSSIKGTTRDVVEGKIVLDGITLNLFDTAGIRESSDFIEEIGIKKSKEKLEKADLVIAVFDSTTLDDEDKEILNLIKDKESIVVFNKKDLIGQEDENNLYISALNNDIEPLKKEIINRLGLESKNYDLPSINNTREIAILENIVTLLEDVLFDIKDNKPIDLLASDIQVIYLKILSLTGEDYDFDIAKEIFSRFCVGK